MADSVANSSKANKLKKDARLGKGLESLLKNNSLLRQSNDLLRQAHSENKNPNSEEVHQIYLDQIQPSKYQPRNTPSNLDELASSIRQHGVMQPIIVRPAGKDKYELVAGERRWRASQLAGKSSVPAIVRGIADETAITLALIENIQREDLDPIEEAKAFKRLQDKLQLTQQKVAEVVGKSRAAVANSLRLLNLHPRVQDLLQQAQLDAGHARNLITLDSDLQLKYAERIVAERLNVRQVEKIVSQGLASQSAKRIEAIKLKDKDLENLERKLSAQLHTSVSLRPISAEKGRLVINYGSLRELDDILNYFKK